MSTWGMDVAGLQAVAADLERYAGSIDQSRRSVDSGLARTAWVGPNADAFRGRWRGIAVRDLDGLRGELAAAAVDLRRQAQDQLDASSRGRGGPTSAATRGAKRDQIITDELLRTLWRVSPPLAIAVWTAVNYGVPLSRHVLEGVLSDPAGLAESVVDETLEAISRGLLSPIRVLEKGQLLDGTNRWLVRNEILRGSKTSLTAGAFLATATSVAFDRWYEDADQGFSTGERTLRAGSDGLVTAAVGLGASKAAMAGASVLLGGPVVAGVVGIAAGAYLVHQVSNSDGFRDTAAGIGSTVYRAQEGVADAARAARDLGADALRFTAERSTPVLQPTVVTPRMVVESVGEVATEAISTVRSRLPGLFR